MFVLILVGLLLIFAACSIAVMVLYLEDRDQEPWPMTRRR